MILVRTFAVTLSVLHVTLVDTPGRVVEFTLTLHETIRPFTFIAMSLILSEEVSAGSLNVVAPLSIELIAILVDQKACSLLVITDEFTFVRSVNVEALALRGESPVGE